VAIRAQQRFAWYAEALHVHRMAHAVSGTAVPDAKLFAGAAQKQMIVGILEIGLEQVVIDVLRGELGLDSGKVHRFELKHHHGSGGILGKSLVNFKAGLLSGFHAALDQMAADQLLADIFAHASICFLQHNRVRNYRAIAAALV
jgi:hypothetical protein